MTPTIYTGIVEDRENDPLRICRYKVRIVGIHSPYLADLSTNDLPWAIPIINNSASVSGIGFSGNGYVNGSTVAIMFADDDNQIPLIMGAIAGYSGDSSKSSFDPIQDTLSSIPPTVPPKDVVQLPSGQQIPLDNSNAGLPGATVVEQPYIGSLTESQVKKLKDTIALSESGTKGYSAINSLGFLGKYQFGALFLEDMGYIVKGSYKKIGNNLKVISDPKNWTGTDGISSKETFLGSSSVQESCMDKMLKRNYSSLVKSIGMSIDTPPEKTAGLLMTSHLKGAGINGGAAGYVKKGQNTTDANGTSCEAYYKKGYACISGKGTTESPTVENLNTKAIDTNSAPDVPQVSKVLPNGQLTPVTSSPYIVPNKVLSETATGFIDPNGVYPLTDHNNESDTPRVVSGQKLLSTAVSTKTDDIDNHIPVANSNVSWNQSPIPYNAQYPYNHAYVSESGHMFEFDDTKDAERIHLYHTSGTFFEIDTDGNKTDKVIGTRTIIVGADELIYIKGSGHVTLDGDLSLKIGGQCQIEISGDANIVVNGNMISEVSGDVAYNVSGNFNVQAGGEINLIAGSNLNTSGLDINLLANSNLNLTAAAEVNSLAGGSNNIDGSKIAMMEGAAANAASPNTPLSSTGFLPEILSPKPTTLLESYVISLEGPENVDDRNIIVNSTAPTNNIPKEIKDTAPVAGIPSVATIITDCNFGNLSMTTQLSTNFKLKDLVFAQGLPFPFGAGQNGLSDNEIACNLRKLCVNILEPLRAKYSDKGFKLNSGFRLGAGKSQHNLGQAADISFTSIRGKGSYQDQVNGFFDIAKEINSLGLPIDQLIFETDPAKGWVWIHVSFNSNAVLPRSDGTGVMSYYGEKPYIKGLVLKS